MVNNVVHSSVRLILMSAGIMFFAILFSFSFRPLLLNSSEAIPSIWSAIKSWFRPPYLYFIINAIILTIAASSRLLHHAPSHAPPSSATTYNHDHHAFFPVTSGGNNAGSSFYDAVSVDDVNKEDVVVVSNSNVQFSEPPPMVVVKDVVVESCEKSIPAPKLVRHKPLTFSQDNRSSEKPPATSRFAHHRRAPKPEGGKSLRVAKPKKQETLEGTWRAITEGRHIPLTRHLKKSDTWENQSRQINLLDDPIPSSPLVKKCETFKDRTNHSPTRGITPSKLKKEPSLSQDELNRRVEAFINNFNQEMRLQRQQSMQQFLETINRAA